MSIVNERLVQLIMLNEAKLYKIYDQFNAGSSRSKAIALVDILRQLEAEVNTTLNEESQERRKVNGKPYPAMECFVDSKEWRFGRD